MEGGRTYVVATHTYTSSAHVYAGHYCQPSLGGHRAPRRPLKFAESVPQTREFPSKTSSIFFIDREISLQTRLSFRIPGFAHFVPFWKNFFFGQNGIEIPSPSDRRYRNIEDTFREAFKIYLCLNGNGLKKNLGSTSFPNAIFLIPLLVPAENWQNVRKNVRFDLLRRTIFSFLFFFFSYIS